MRNAILSDGVSWAVPCPNEIHYAKVRLKWRICSWKINSAPFQHSQFPRPFLWNIFRVIDSLPTHSLPIWHLKVGIRSIYIHTYIFILILHLSFVDGMRVLLVAMSKDKTNESYFFPCCFFFFASNLPFHCVYSDFVVTKFIFFILRSFQLSSLLSNFHAKKSKLFSSSHFFGDSFDGLCFASVALIKNLIISFYAFADKVFFSCCAFLLFN